MIFDRLRIKEHFDTQTKAIYQSAYFITVLFQYIFTPYFTWIRKILFKRRKLILGKTTSSLIFTLAMRKKKCILHQQNNNFWYETNHLIPEWPSMLLVLLVPSVIPLVALLVYGSLLLFVVLAPLFNTTSSFRSFYYLLSAAR